MPQMSSWYAAVLLQVESEYGRSPSSFHPNNTRAITSVLEYIQHFTLVFSNHAEQKRLKHQPLQKNKTTTQFLKLNFVLRKGEKL